MLERFLSARGKTLAEKAANACPKCELFPTKKRRGKVSAEKMVNLARRAIRIREENRAGYTRSENDMSVLEFEALLLIDKYFESYERACERETLLESIALMFVGGKNR